MLAQQLWLSFPLQLLAVAFLLHDFHEAGLVVFTLLPLAKATHLSIIALPRWKRMRCVRADQSPHQGHPEPLRARPGRRGNGKQAPAAPATVALRFAKYMFPESRAILHVARRPGPLFYLLTCTCDPLSKLLAKSMFRSAPFIKKGRSSSGGWSDLARRMF